MVHTPRWQMLLHAMSAGGFLFLVVVVDRDAASAGDTCLRRLALASAMYWPYNVFDSGNLQHRHAVHVQARKTAVSARHFGMGL